MKNKTIAKIVSIAASGALLSSVGSVLLGHSERNEDGTYNVTEDNRSTLLGISDEQEYFLGAASQFSVFLKDDFAAYGSDCEGRLAAGGNANLGDPVSYSVGAKLDEGADFADIVVGGDTLTNFQPAGRKLVVGKNGIISDEIKNHISSEQCEVYVGQLIDFDKEFELLNERSNYLAEQPQNAELTINEYYQKSWKIVGTDSNLNVVNLTDEQLKLFNGDYLELNIQIPEGSFLVFNVSGENVSMPATLMKLYDEDGELLQTGGENMPVLYNLKDATEFKYSGSIQGSTLAPDAKASGDEGGHVAGATIAKSFSGGIEFGYSLFNPKMPSIVVTTTTTTETTTSATTTSATTTTETTTSSTTTSATTTTETTTSATTTSATTTTETTTSATTTSATTTTETTTSSTTTSTTTETTTTSSTTTSATTTTETTTSSTTTSATTTTETTTSSTTTSTTTETTTSSTTTSATTTTETTTSSTTTSATTETTTTTTGKLHSEKETVTTTSNTSTTTTSTTAKTTTTTGKTNTNTVNSPKTADKAVTGALVLLGISAAAMAVSRKHEDK